MENIKTEPIVVLQKLGEGTFGSTVFLCKKEHNQQKFVAKEIHVKENDKSLQIAKNEAAILKSIKHPNVVRHFDSFYKNGIFYIYLQYCSKGTLHDYIAKLEAPLSYSQVENYFGQILLGLDCLHGKKIMHRDLKCENIFLAGYKGELVKIGDFGVSKILKSDGKTKTIIGTTNYMAPEILEGHPYDFKSDIWSLGCILYEMCNRERLFNDHPYSVIASIKSGAKFIDSNNYGSILMDTLIACLRPNPEDRPDTATLLLNKAATAIAYNKLIFSAGLILPNEGDDKQELEQEEVMKIKSGNEDAGILCV